MKLRRKLFVAVSSLAVASAVLLAGCGVPAQEGTALKETGILTLSVNPEIQIEYNRDGKVTALTGLNHDGKSIVDAYPDYIGKDCETVLRDLIVEINEAGYFVDDIDGNKKDIVLQLEPGSVLPSDDFLEDMSASTREAVKGLSLPSDIVTIDDDDYDPAYSKDGKPSSYITLEKAKEIALEHAKVAENSLIFDKVEKDYEDRRLVYEVEFVTNDGMEYDYEIDASSGTIVKYDFDAEYYAPSGTSRSRRQNGSSQAADASQISEDDAKRIALEQAGISEKQASYLHVKKDWDDGYVLYEGKFFYNELEYEFEIDAQTGRILEWDVESIYD